MFNNQIFVAIFLLVTIFFQRTIIVNAWKSRECPIDSQDNRETYLCIRPCDYYELDDNQSTNPNRNNHNHGFDEFNVGNPFIMKDDGTQPSRNQHARELNTNAETEAEGASAIAGSSSAAVASSSGTHDDSFFVVFFPPKNIQYEKSRFKCPSGFKQTKENGQCFCERPYTPYEMEMQRREKCDQSFERCRMYGAKPYDCNHIIDSCPTNLIREYCLAGKVFKMRFAKVVYEFCHAFLRLPNDGRNHFLEPNIDRKKH